MEYQQVYKNPMEWLKLQMKQEDLFILWNTKVELEHEGTWPNVVSITRNGAMHKRGGLFYGVWRASDDEHTMWVPIRDLPHLREMEGELTPPERRVRDQ